MAAHRIAGDRPPAHEPTFSFLIRVQVTGPGRVVFGQTHGKGCAQLHAQASEEFGPPVSERSVVSGHGRKVIDSGAVGHACKAKVQEDTVQGYALQTILLFYAAPRTHPMIRCHLSTLMGRDKLRIAEVARRTGLNRSTIAALYKETTTRVDLPAVERLCRLFRCRVGDIFEYIPDADEASQ